MSCTNRVSCVVIGAGALGLSVAKAMSEAGVLTMVLEKNRHFGEENSSRHSEVIHAGLYYPHSSHKHRFCVAGNVFLHDYITTRNITHRKCGKLIIATTDSELRKLQSLLENGEVNGVKDLMMLSQTDVKNMEPEIICKRAILSPSTSIFDSHSLLLNYVADIENSQSDIVYNCEVLAVNKVNITGCAVIGVTPASTSAFCVSTSQGDVYCDYIVNAAGLFAQYVSSKMLSWYSRKYIPTPYYAKGNYYKLTGRSRAPFSRLIYPLPSEGGLGIHATLDLSGGVRFGPDVEWIPAVIEHDEYAHGIDEKPYHDFAVNEHKTDLFIKAIPQYYPNIRHDDLTPDYAGIRPKLCGPVGDSTAIATNRDVKTNEESGYVMKASADFCIQGPAEHGVEGLVQLYGIESPGLTSSLAIAMHVRDILMQSK